MAKGGTFVAGFDVQGHRHFKRSVFKSGQSIARLLNGKSMRTEKERSRSAHHLHGNACLRKREAGISHNATFQFHRLACSI